MLLMQTPQLLNFNSLPRVVYMYVTAASPVAVRCNTLIPFLPLYAFVTCSSVIFTFNFYIQH